MLIHVFGPIYHCTAAHRKVKQTNVELIKSARRLRMWVLTFLSFALSWHLISDQGWAHIFIGLASEEAAGWYFPERAQAPYRAEGQSVMRTHSHVCVKFYNFIRHICYGRGRRHVVQTNVNIQNRKKKKKSVVDWRLIIILFLNVNRLQAGWFVWC